MLNNPSFDFFLKETSKIYPVSHALWRVWEYFEILNQQFEYPLLDLGCGDGKKAEIFVKHLKGNIKLRYCPVDISGYMVNKAMQRLKKLGAGEVVNFQWNISDFENIENIAGLLRREDYKKNLFLLLGNTLGNFEINELLYEIRSAMKEGDFLFIGNGLDTKKKGNIMKSYLNTDVDNFLKHIPAQLGLDKKDVEFGVRFQNSRIEVYYTIIEDKEIAFQDKKVQFNKGDQIIAAVSYKYDKHDFTAYLRMYFDFVKLISSKDDSYAVALCKK